MSRKRDKPYSNHYNHHNPKRRRPHQAAAAAEEEDRPVAKAAAAPGLVVMGLAAGCSVLDLKSRFEIYGSISRIRIDRDGVGFVAFRTRDAAEAAVAASLDPSFGVTVQSHRVQVMWATDPLAQWRGVVGLGGGGGGGANKDNATSSSSPSSSSSKLLRPEVPLSRHGRGNKLASAVVNPRSGDAGASEPSRSDAPFRGREIVAYDDIL